MTDRRRRGPHWHPEAVRLLRAGKRPVEVAEMLGVTKGAVYNLVTKAGLTQWDWKHPTDAALVEAYLAGATPTGIGDQVGVSAGRVLRAVREAGVVRGRGGKSNREEEAVRMHRDGRPVQEIARKLGVSRAWARAVVEHLGEEVSSG